LVFAEFGEKLFVHPCGHLSIGDVLLFFVFGQWTVYFVSQEKTVYKDTGGIVQFRQSPARKNAPFPGRHFYELPYYLWYMPLLFSRPHGKMLLLC